MTRKSVTSPAGIGPAATANMVSPTKVRTMAMTLATMSKTM